MSPRLKSETQAVAEDYINYSLGIQQTPPSEPAQAMRHLAKKMERQYHLKFQSLSEAFLSSCGTDTSACLKKVMEELVGDGTLNWGRVVSLFTFTGVLASDLHSRGESRERCRRLAETIADYLGGEKQAWLKENDGWEGFRRFSSCAAEMNQESSMKTALFAAAGVGIAGLTFLLVR
ncbi:bcl-2-like protein 10 [Conger conger]|uniref:bcl-2-like protein 10 n=1 Tax=Conger conger TaxID=82655 RepID=UPI002A5ACE29|nr:bcl-2-like protein 10 [Conger conger]